MEGKKSCDKGNRILRGSRLIPWRACVQDLIFVWLAVEAFPCKLLLETDHRTCSSDFLARCVMSFLLPFSTFEQGPQSLRKISTLEIARENGTNANSPICQSGILAVEHTVPISPATFRTNPSSQTASRIKVRHLQG